MFPAICIALGKTQNAENKKPYYQHWKIGQEVGNSQVCYGPK